jgi:hypothetical protein
VPGDGAAVGLLTIGGDSPILDMNGGIGEYAGT